jgi:hypothetical protein
MEIDFNSLMDGSADDLLLPCERFDEKRGSPQPEFFDCRGGIKSEAGAVRSTIHVIASEAKQSRLPAWLWIASLRSQ